jgi:uncharacterized protein
LKDLIKKGHTVYPINPKEDYIENIKAYKSLSEVNDDFEIVNFVVKPEITLQILEKNVEKLKNKTIWCQPGASDSNIEDFLKNNFTNYITESCIMIEDITKKD